MFIKLLQKKKVTKDFIYKIGYHRAKIVEKWIEGFINENDKVLDIGAGSCNICEIIKQRNPVIPIDIKNLSFVDYITPFIYDGKNLPFFEGNFDVALICTVLHHTSNPEEIIKEAKRVSGKIIIIEDIFTNPFQKYLTFFVDSLVNLEFTGHPHSNKSDAEWKKVFLSLNLKLVEVRYFRVFLLFKQVVYYLKKMD